MLMRSGAFKIAVLYTVVGILWILISDKLLSLAEGKFNLKAILLIGSIKGFAYVFLTGYLLQKLIIFHHSKLTNSEKSFRSYYEDNPIPMWIYKRSTLKFLSVNHAAIANYGYTNDEFLTMTIADIRPPEDFEKLQNIIKYRPLDYKDVGIWRHKKKDGTILFVHITSHPLSMSDGDEVMVMAKDTTERLLYEQKLQQANNELLVLNEELFGQKRLLNKIQQISKIGGWEFYFQAGKLEQSDGMYEIYDFTYADDPDPMNNLLEHVHPDDTDEFLANNELLNASNDPIVSNFRVIDKNGNFKYIRQMAQMESRNGKPFRISGSVQDISDIRIAEEERNEYFLKLEDTLNSVSDGLFTLDKNFMVTSVNAMFETISGYKKETIVNRNFFELWPNTINTPYEKNITKALSAKITIKFEEFSPVLNKWLRLVCYPTKEGLAIYFTDITDGKIKDIQLKEALERYNYAAMATQDMFYELDLLTKKFSFGKNFGLFLKSNLTEQEYAIELWDLLVHPDDKQKLYQAREDIVKNRSSIFECEYRVDTGDGEYHTVHDQAYIIYNEAGHAIRKIGAIRDITYLIKTGEENKRQAEIIAKINNMVSITNKNHEVVWLNKAFETATGFTLAEVYGLRPISFLAGPEIDEDKVLEIAEHQRRHESYSIELEIYTRAKQPRWIYSEFTPLSNEYNEPNGYITIYTDITAIKEKEMSLMKQNDILRDIAWLSSHELRRPLASILALINLLENSDDPSEKEEFLSLLNISANELDLMVHKINDNVYKVAV